YDLAPRDVGGVSLTPSADALALVRSLESTAGSLCEEIGCATAALGRTREAESGAGDAVADLMRAAFPGADLAIQNSGGIRADFPAGKLRREHVQAVMPFQNRTLLVEVSGAKLATLFRIGTSGAHGLPQVSGARYRYDPTRTGGSDLDGSGAVEAWETDRLCWVEVGGKRVDPAKTYKLVTTDFLLGGGDHLGPALADAPVLAEGALLRDVLITGIDAAEDCLPALPDRAAPRIETGPCEGPR
ncbi:MAG: 5'-nucleotidase C-terminal domain-containing protein, partial [Deltaproteobacteria bacterium]|nr:5'-nucleotidase C-terminal domain-containing protein [Deltaproteobacteria bacterium]